MEKQFVANLKANDAVHSDFLVVEKSLVPFTQPNRAGEQFLRIQLADVTGKIPAVVWDKGTQFAELFNVGDVIRVRGEVGTYRGLQLVVSSLEPVKIEEVQRSHFQPVAPREQKEMLAHLESVLNKITNPYINQLMESFFHDPDFVAMYSAAPAARSVHHNYVGGLLQHSLEVADFCVHFAQMFPALDQSLLLSGALLHDMGKIEEYDASSMSFELTTRGKLLGHIIIGKEMLDERVRGIADFPEELYMELSHMLLAHHGQKEWGSPEIPRTFSAYALHHADLVSARLNQFDLSLSKGNSQNGWTQWDRLLERDIYLGLAK